MKNRLTYLEKAFNEPTNQSNQKMQIFPSGI